MTTSTLLPTGTASSSGTTTATGGSVPTIITDASDSTLLRLDASTTQGVIVSFDLGTFTLGTGRLKSWAATVRGAVTTPSALSLGLAFVNSVTGAVYPLSGLAWGPSSGTKLNQSTAAAIPPGLSQAEIDALRLRLTWIVNENTSLYMYELSAAVTYAVAPTAAITYPTGTPAIGASSFTATWTHSAGADGGPQALYEWKVFTAAQYGAGGFSPDTSTVTLGSGVVSSAAAAATVGPLANSETFRIYVRTAQMVNGVAHWSPWVNAGFTTSYTPVALTSVTCSPDNDTAKITVTVTRPTSGGNPAWSTVEVERQDPDGVWRPVRGATGASVTNGFVSTFSSTSFVVNDFEAANGATVSYRARATTSAGTVGAWTVSSSTSWSDSVRWWLKDVHDPTLNLVVADREFPQPTSPVTQGVFPIVNGRFPKVVTDVRRARQGTFVVQTHTLVESAAFDEAVLSIAKLLQSPTTSLWDSKYVALGAVQEMHLDTSTELFARRWQIAYTEVERPADETDY